MLLAVVTGKLKVVSTVPPNILDEFFSLLVSDAAFISQLTVWLSDSASDASVSDPIGGDSVSDVEAGAAFSTKEGCPHSTVSDVPELTCSATTVVLEEESESPEDDVEIESDSAISLMTVSEFKDVMVVRDGVENVTVVTAEEEPESLLSFPIVPVPKMFLLFIGIAEKTGFPPFKSSAPVVVGDENRLLPDGKGLKLNIFVLKGNTLPEFVSEFCKDSVV